MRKLFILICALGSGCIGTDILDDAVEPEIIILNSVEEIEVGTSYEFMAEYRNMTGMREDIPLVWGSSDDSIIEIDRNGVATALMQGTAEIRVSGLGLETRLLVEAGDMTSGPVTSRIAILNTSSSYPLEGTATLSRTSDGLLLRLESDFRTTSALPGLYVYLSNNVSTTNNAYEIGRVIRFSGEQEYLISDLSNLSEFNYVLFFCKPFVVPVGHGELIP